MNQPFPLAQRIAWDDCASCFWRATVAWQLKLSREMLFALPAEHGFRFVCGMRRLSSRLGPGRCGAGGGRHWRRCAKVIAASREPSATTRMFAVLAEACLRAGRIDEGLETRSPTALAEAERTGERYAEAELYRLKGELLLMRDPPTRREAERVFAPRSRSPAEQGAKSWELRATTSLARLLESRASATKRARCSPKSTTGSPRASTPPT